VDIHLLPHLLHRVVELAAHLAAVVETHLTGRMMVDLEPMVDWVEQKILDNKIFIKNNRCQYDTIDNITWELLVMMKLWDF
jgi:hypothetical protein